MAIKIVSTKTFNKPYWNKNDIENWLIKNGLKNNDYVSIDGVNNRVYDVLKIQEVKEYIPAIPKIKLKLKRIVDKHGCQYQVYYKILKTWNDEVGNSLYLIII